MAGDTGPQPEAIKVKGSAAVIIAFSADDPATPQVTVHGATLGQVMAAAWFLDCYATELRQGQLAQEQLGGLLPPEALGAILRGMNGSGPNGRD